MEVVGISFPIESIKKTNLKVVLNSDEKGPISTFFFPQNFGHLAGMFVFFDLEVLKNAWKYDKKKVIVQSNWAKMYQRETNITDFEMQFLAVFSINLLPKNTLQ